MTTEQLQELLKDMSLEEKIGQLCQLPLSACVDGISEPTGPMAELHLTPRELLLAGSLICDLDADAEKSAALCKDIQARSPHHIPPIIMKDIIHGARTIFPIPLAMGCTFDTRYAAQMGEISAEEAAAAGIHATFAPMVDVVRDPRWGRCMESPGESSLLCAEMGAAMVRGVRGNLDAQHLTCCAKHFAGYGMAQAGQDYMPVDVSHTEMFNVYLPPFKAVLDAGCDMVMPAFTPIDREPAVVSDWLMNRILRQRWGWNGVTISDWNAPGELLTHGVAADAGDAAVRCMDAQLDMDMMSMVYLRTLAAQVQAGKVSEASIDRACLRILTLKNKLGLFERDWDQWTHARQQASWTNAQHRGAALEAALHSCVLLKNEGALPLKPGAKVALTGSRAQDHGLLGGWAADGSTAECATLAEALATCDSLTLCTPKEADVILFAAGEPQWETGEAQSKTNPTLPPEDAAAFAQLCSLGKPIVLVLFSGRPLMIAETAAQCNAVLAAWFPGTMGAEAITRLLTGEANPSGHLSMTWPRCLGQIPIHHDHLSTGRPNHGSNSYVSFYLDASSAPLYPFGHGLSYTTFALRDFAVSKAALTADETAELSVTVENVGDRAGETVVQCYAHGRVHRLMQPVRRLIGWQRVSLAPGESLRVSLPLRADMLTIYDHDGQLHSPQGVYDFALGEASDAPFSLEVAFQ